MPLSAAPAAIIERISATSYYGYLIDSSTGATSEQGADRGQFFVQSPDAAANPSALGVDYTAYGNASGFFFLHQNYCIGTCSTVSQTTIAIEITNTGETGVNLRLDSLITPGHMSLFNASNFNVGSFNFTVSQTVDEGITDLYNAAGYINSDGVQYSERVQSFYGLQNVNPAGSAYQVVDWGATPLNVDLFTIGGGSSATVYYTATYFIRNEAVCDVLETCSSSEIVFGDPRNNGGITGFAREAGVVQPIAGGTYSPFFVPVDIVEAGSALPADPPAKTPTVFLPLNGARIDSAVPEPATWAMMLLGFGAVGLSFRARKNSPGLSGGSSSAACC
jgi:hypothetical protein